MRYNHVSQPRGVRYNPELQPLVSELDDAARTRTRCCPVGGGVHATTGLKPTRVATALSPQQGVLSSVACAWFGLLPKGCRSRVEASVETTLASHVRHGAPRVASRIALCTRPPTTQAEAHRAIPLGYDPPANGQSVLAPSFRGRERAEFQPGLQPERRQTRPLTEARLFSLTPEGPHRLPQYYER